MLDRDRMMMANLREVATAAMTIIDSIQIKPAHIQAPAVAAVIILLAEDWGVPVTDVLEAAGHMVKDADGGKRLEFKAIADYIKNELK